MNNTVKDVLFGTTMMVSIAMCIMVIVFLVIFIKGQKKINGRKMYKDWILFNGLTFIVGSILADLILIPLLRSQGVDDISIKVVHIYNNFIRIIGIGSIFSWALFFLVFDVSGWIDEKLENFSTSKKETT